MQRPQGFLAAYLAHLAALGPTLPDVARRLATEVSLHDALLRGVERKNGRLESMFGAYRRPDLVTVGAPSSRTSTSVSCEIHASSLSNVWNEP
jgi:hypothetical protein